MKVVQIINSLSTGGAEKFVVETALQLKKDGLDVEVIVIDRSDSHFSKTLRDNGIKINYTLSPRLLSPLNFFSFIRIVNSSKYNVVHTHLTYAQLWCSLASLFKFRTTKLVTSEHSNNNNRRGHRLLRIVDKFIYSRYSKVLCVSETTKNSLIEWLCSKNNEKFVVVENCVDTEQFRNVIDPIQKSSLGLSSCDKVVMMVGRMSEAKDQKTLIKAVEMLPKEYKCVLVGGGDTSDKVKSCICDSTRTIMTGNRTDIVQLIAMCDIYVQSSHWEGLPTTVLEAMAAGKVTLGSAVRGVVDIVPEEQLFEHENARELAELITKFTTQDIGKAISTQNEILKLYDVKEIAKKIEKYYE